MDLHTPATETLETLSDAVLAAQLKGQSVDSEDRDRLAFDMLGCNLLMVEAAIQSRSSGHSKLQNLGEESEHMPEAFSRQRRQDHYNVDTADVGSVPGNKNLTGCHLK